MKIVTLVFFLCVCVCVCFSSITPSSSESGSITFGQGPSGNFYGLESFASDEDTNFLMSEACKSRTWYTCPAGSGTSSKSTGYPDCCPNKSDYYCPNGAQECISGGGCCQTGFDVHCSTGGKSWCCSSAYPICGFDGGCYDGSCSCGVCAGSVDSCQFQSCGDSCSSCCNMYSHICQGPATCKSSKGFLGVKTTHADRQCYPIEDSQSPIPGRFYFVKSKFGHYLDMRQEQQAYIDALAITESNKDSNLWALDSFKIELIDNGDGYYKLKSKFGRYLDMRQVRDDSYLPALSISETHMNKNLWAKDSFLVQLIDNGDGYYMIKSKHGRYLDLRQEYGTYPALSISETHMKTNLWAKDSFVVKFIIAN